MLAVSAEILSSALIYLFSYYFTVLSMFYQPKTSVFGVLEMRLNDQLHPTDSTFIYEATVSLP